MISPFEASLLFQVAPKTFQTFRQKRPVLACTMEKVKIHARIEIDTDDHFYYFAYGSNLLTERLHLLNPSAVYVCNAVLLGYRLDFAGRSQTWGGSAATIVEDNEEVVCGVVWKLGREHSETLDLQERSYRRLHVDVKILPAGDQNVRFTNGHTGKWNIG